MLAIALSAFALCAAAVAAWGYGEGEAYAEDWVVDFCPVAADLLTEIERIQTGLPDAASAPRARVEDVAEDLDDAVTSFLDDVDDPGVPVDPSWPTMEASIDELVDAVEAAREEVLEDVALLDEGLEVESVAATEIASLALILESLWGVRESFNIDPVGGQLDDFFFQTQTRDCNTFKSWDEPPGR